MEPQVKLAELFTTVMSEYSTVQNTRRN